MRKWDVRMREKKGEKVENEFSMGERESKATHFRKDKTSYREQDCIPRVIARR